MTASIDTYTVRTTSGNGGLPSEITIPQGERRELLLIVLPGVCCDINLDIHLAGSGAEAEISGLFICKGKERVNININLYHETPGCSSRQSFKGIVASQARASFCGKVCVKPDAQKTQAYQQSSNLLLSDKARVDSSPQLEIYADDVVCSHGATCGKLNDDELFYMRSRGITLQRARALQMTSFIAPVLEKVADPALKEEIGNAVLQMAELW